MQRMTVTPSESKKGGLRYFSWAEEREFDWIRGGGFWSEEGVTAIYAYRLTDIARQMVGSRKTAREKEYSI